MLVTKTTQGSNPILKNNKTCCIGVCTTKRPYMLRSCLESLINLDIPPEWQVSIVIVDNEGKPSASAIVNEIAEKSRFPLLYVHEPKRGIPFARNRAIDACLSLNAVWIAFIDDDEVADKNWLRTLLCMADKTPADVFHGLTKYNYPASCQKWVKPKKTPSRRTGDSLVTCSTNNVMFKAQIVHPDGLGLRFDESRALTGGSDTDFFYRVTDSGGSIIRVTEAIVTENVPEGRCTFKWKIKRCYRCSASASSIEIKRKGYIAATLRLAPKFFLNLLEGTAIYVSLPILLFLHMQSFRRLLFKACRKFVSAIGIIAAYVGYLPKPYKTIDGQ